MRKTTISRATSCSLGRAAAVALALGSVSCGKRGDPLPPLRPLPSAAEAVRLSQVGYELRLRWKAPSQNQDGTVENLDLREARVLRRVVDYAALGEAQSAAGASETTEPSPTVSPEAPPVVAPFASEAETVANLESLLPGEDLSHRELIDPLWLGKRVEYAVAHRNRRNLESPLSTIVQVDPVPELAAPLSLVAESGDGFVALNWTTPGAAAEGVGYAVYRRLAADERYPDSPLRAELVRERAFEDRTASFGTAFCWVVSAVLAGEPEEALEPVELQRPSLVPPIAGPVRIESAPSAEACLTPEDVFAPRAPEDLVGVPSGGGILLTWRAVEAADLGGYRVYRSTSPDGDFELLADVSRTSYADAAASVGIAYFYFVTALDQAPSPNESPRSETVSMTRRE